MIFACRDSSKRSQHVRPLTIEQWRKKAILLVFILQFLMPQSAKLWRHTGFLSRTAFDAISSEFLTGFLPLRKTFTARPKRVPDGFD
jgi:hypothetical protein